MSNSKSTLSSGNSDQDLVNSSGLSFQKIERINKMTQLLKLGFEPFAANCHRDFEIGFVKFWFDFVHKFEFKKIEIENDLYILDDFLDMVLFPIDLLEHAENILEKRNLAIELGVDPQDVELDNDFEPQTIKEARSLFPELGDYSEKEKIELKSKFLKNDDKEKSENWQNYLNITLVKNQKITLSGRVRNKKSSGKIAFAKLVDQSCDSGFQLIFKKDLVDYTIETREIDEIINFFS